MRVDGSRIRNEKVADSKISGKVLQKRTVLMATWSVFHHLIVSLSFFRSPQNVIAGNYLIFKFHEPVCSPELLPIVQQCSDI